MSKAARSKPTGYRRHKRAWEVKNRDKFSKTISIHGVAKMNKRRYNNK